MNEWVKWKILVVMMNRYSRLLYLKKKNEKLLMMKMSSHWMMLRCLISVMWLI